MKRLFPLFMSLAGVVFVACERPPEYDNIPHLTFEDVYFLDTEEPGQPDTLVLEVYFEDGNGDIGLGEDDENRPPFHFFEYVTDGDGDTVRLGDYPGMPPYSEKDYVVERPDTFLVEYNENYFNFFLELLVKKNGEYTKLGEDVFNVPFNARIPPLKDGDDDPDRALEGTIAYHWGSRGWLSQLGLDTLKARVRIQDRALNKSNTVESPDFTLVGVTRK